MHEKIVVSIIQYPCAEGKKEENLHAACRLLDEVGKRGTDVALLPELFTTEYFPIKQNLRYFAYAEAIPGPTTEEVGAVAVRHRMYVVAPFFEKRQSGVYYNAAALIGRNGELVGIYRKTHIPAIKSIEKYYFRPGGELPVFDTDFGKVGIAICQDRIFPEPFRILALKGACIFFVANAAGDYAGIREMWRPIQQARAYENAAFYISSNRVGQEGEVVFFGQSMVISPHGEILKEAGDKEEVLTVEIDLDQVEEARLNMHVFRDLRPELYRTITEWRG